MKKIFKHTLGTMGVLFLLTGCGGGNTDDIELTETPFNPQSSVRTRVQQELANNTSYARIDYQYNYSFGVNPKTFVNAIQTQYKNIIPHVNGGPSELTFVELKDAPIISTGSNNQAYLVNDLIVVNFVVPKNNSVEWDGTVSNVQFYYDSTNLTAAQLMNLISMAITQEIESPQTALLIGENKDQKISNYDFIGGTYEISGKLINLSKESKDFILKSLGLKSKDYLNCFSLERHA